MRQHVGLLLTSLVSLLPVKEVHGHDYWLQPATFFPAVKQPVAVRLLVGDGFISELERPFQTAVTRRFVLLSADGSRDLSRETRDGAKPLISLALPKAGTYWLMIERDAHYLTLPAEKFNAYLAEEGLQAILEQRRQAGEDKQPGREKYSRYLKCLLQAGATADDTWKKTGNLRLEIIPLSNPPLLKPGDRLKVRILFEGKALPAARVFADHRSGAKVQTQALTTAKDGTAEIVIAESGPWLVRLVHMQRCGNDPKADWESFWGALTFGVR
jgi:uncharacterized GH25 family protein